MTAAGANTAAAILAQRFALPGSPGLQVQMLHSSVAWQLAWPCVLLRIEEQEPEGPCLVQELAAACQEPEEGSGEAADAQRGQRVAELAGALTSIPEKAASCCLRALSPAAFADQASWTWQVTLLCIQCMSGLQPRCCATE